MIYESNSVWNWKSWVWYTWRPVCMCQIEKRQNRLVGKSYLIITTPRTKRGTTSKDLMPARPISTPSVSKPQTTSAMSLVKSGTRSGFLGVAKKNTIFRSSKIYDPVHKNCGRFGICLSPFPGRFCRGRTWNSSFRNWPPEVAIINLALSIGVRLVLMQKISLLSSVALHFVRVP